MMDACIGFLFIRWTNSLVNTSAVRPMINTWGGIGGGLTMIHGRDIADPSGDDGGDSDAVSDPTCDMGQEGCFCTECDPGFFKNTTDNRDCLPCSPGRFTAIVGTISCNNCPSGQFQSDFNATGCDICVGMCTQLRDLTHHLIPH